MRPHQDGHLLSVLAYLIDEGRSSFVGDAQAIDHDRLIDKAWIEFNNRLPFRQFALDFLCPLGPRVYVLQRLRDGAHRPARLQWSIKAHKGPYERGPGGVRRCLLAGTLGQF
ncbi:hypothetical protein MesoLj131a_66390 (plasmid) [Mesorhizobium sp. 131-2-1]|nr:hypothetical protein MesoLj131a_66390 [Mesorhizobium sp. 131-2-1]